MGQPIYLVDAFAHAPFTGNPAGVCPLEKPADVEWMLNVAMEMNQAETAFVSPRADGYDLRWFTPTMEIGLCGHATLATAHVLWESGRADPTQTLAFHTKGGQLTCKRAGELIEMDFPSMPPTETAKSTELASILGADIVWQGTSGFVAIVELADEQTVRSLNPDMGKLNSYEDNGVIVTARSSGDQDFVSRFFAPRLGVPEDSVTGSAHCSLAPYWATKLGRNELVGYQASSRGGFVKVVQRGERVGLCGKAITFLRGELA